METNLSLGEMDLVVCLPATPFPRMDHKRRPPVVAAALPFRLMVGEVVTAGRAAVPCTAIPSSPCTMPVLCVAVFVTRLTPLSS